MPLRSIRRSHMEAWVKNMTSRLSPTTIDTKIHDSRRTSLFAPRPARTRRGRQRDHRCHPAAQVRVRADDLPARRRSSRSCSSTSGCTRRTAVHHAGSSTKTASRGTTTSSTTAGMRRGHRAAGHRPRVSDDHAQHVRTSVADGRGQEPCSGLQHGVHCSRSDGPRSRDHGVVTTDRFADDRRI